MGYGTSYHITHNHRQTTHKPIHDKKQNRQTHAQHNWTYSFPSSAICDGVKLFNIRPDVSYRIVDAGVMDRDCDDGLADGDLTLGSCVDCTLSGGGGKDCDADADVGAEKEPEPDDNGSAFGLANGVATPPHRLAEGGPAASAAANCGN